MSDYATIQLGPDFIDALSGATRYCDDDARMIKVRPPKQNNGIDASINMLRSFHDVKTEKRGLTKTKNVSDVSAMELWYDKEELQFMYYVPNEDRENDFRRQIDGYFRGAQIEAERDRFVGVNEGDYVAGAEVWLNHHYFEPIRNKEGVEKWDDPYQMLFNGIDTRDSTRALVQILFKPAEDDWTRTAFERVDDYAEGLSAKKKESRLGGLLTTERSATEDEQNYAAKVTRQAGRPAFYVNIRYVIISQQEEQAIKQAEHIARLFNVGYREVSGQTLVAHPATAPENVSELVRKIAAREPVKMERPRGYLSQWKHANFGDSTRRMIMTLPEVAGITHFPTSKEVDSDAINWTEMPVEGSLPHDAKWFIRLTHEERRQQLRRWQQQKQEVAEKYGLTEEDMHIANGRPNDPQNQQTSD